MTFSFKALFLIMCNIKRGDKPYRITWNLKGDIISSDPDLTTTMLGTQASLLTINNVGFRHSGVYTCQAENTAGVTSYSASLKVNGKMSQRALEMLLN